jgi:integrase
MITARRCRSYGAGLRASEIVSLKTSDVDSERMTLRVEQGHKTATPFAQWLVPLRKSEWVVYAKIASATAGCWPMPNASTTWLSPERCCTSHCRRPASKQLSVDRSRRCSCAAIAAPP